MSLRVTHPSRTPESITAALAIAPGNSWMIGTQRMNRTGQPVGVRSETFWTARLVDGAWPGLDIAGAIGAALDELVVGPEWFVELNESGGSSELFLGWFVDDGNSGDVFDYKLLARLADYRMNLSFDVYPEKNED